ncbi:MAG: hypothetical protein JWO36_4575 [Myxococcales bacterium]|nr:hypothetical protein [Myxococcales bacterium]
MTSEKLQELSKIIASGEATLFTGAGFSSDARDTAGNGLPDSAQMVRELWPLVFGDDPPDDSTLADLYDVALLRAPERLRDYMTSRLRIGDGELPRSYAAWFSGPWRRIYTLNVDDLEVAVARQFELPRRLRSLSALSDGPSSESSELDVIHLNGIAGDDPRQVTFSTMQYAARLCMRDRHYEQLIEDLRASPFVFVGTTLDEAVLWQHLELDRQMTGNTKRPHSFLISRALTRARQMLLSHHRIHWIQATTCEIADDVLSSLLVAAGIRETEPMQHLVDRHPIDAGGPRRG